MMAERRAAFNSARCVCNRIRTGHTVRVGRGEVYWKRVYLDVEVSIRGGRTVQDFSMNEVVYYEVVKAKIAATMGLYQGKF